MSFYNDEGLLDFTSEFTALAVSLTKVANAFYDSDGQPKDIIYRDLPSVHRLEWQPVSDRLGYFPDRTLGKLKLEEGGDWLQSKGVAQTAKYAFGNSAAVFALRLGDGRFQMLRVAFQRTYTGEPAQQQRLNSPLVLQSPTKLQDVSCVINERTSSESVDLEILPCLPVLPNGIAGLEIVSGHSSFRDEKISGEILQASEWGQLESQKLTFAALLRVAGFDINRVADIGVLPDGTPIFVDPDVLQKGNYKVEIASKRAQNLLNSLGVGENILPCYVWQDKKGVSKQEKFFPAP